MVVQFEYKSILKGLREMINEVAVNKGSNKDDQSNLIPSHDSLHNPKMPYDPH